MTNELLIAAEVLEKAAAYIEAVELEKKSAEEAARTKVAEQLKLKFSEITGETLSDDQVAKLASSEPDVLAFVEKLAGSLQAPDSMGGPGEVQDGGVQPTTKKEAAVAAADRFAEWLTS